MKRYLIGAGAVLLFNAALLSPAAANSGYDPVTGEPDCTSCHTPDRRYSIDYTRDDTCVECHGPGLSEKYTGIDDRFRAQAGEESIVSDAGQASPKKARPAPSSTKGMVLIPAGEFTMGANDWWPKSQPEHKRMVKAFYMDRFEVTNQRFKAFVDSTGRPAPFHWKDGKIPPGKENHPVVYVTWFDADEFCRWEGKRL
ncbi:MAG: SUMF1/EgtB/PvdO family nonheme iron enzyme, partial [Deltaproteobacteria bacterium]|nr:SUMF1/EgtB/PvdO family nonheme iron enzyme [Deltaproteobacteria bacterium]